MLRLIDPGATPGSSIRDSIDLEALFDVAARDICESHSRQADPSIEQEKLPASQRWALSILRHPEAPAGREFDDADLALGVGRDALVRRALSQLRREYDDGKLPVAQCGQRILQVVKSFGLEPVSPQTPPRTIGKKGLGVVCYQVVLPPNRASPSS